MWRRVLEGIGYDYMEVTDQYRAAGIGLKHLTITEGGNRDELEPNQGRHARYDGRHLESRRRSRTDQLYRRAYAAGDIKDLEKSLERQLEVKATYVPDEENTKMYRASYENGEPS